MMNVPLWGWLGFLGFVIAALVIDLGVLNRKAHEIGIREALGWSLAWVVLALGFCGILFYFSGRQPALQFLTGYLLELSLSLDNLFVFLVIFTYFHVPRLNQHKVLFWGIVCALLMRGAFIYVGIELFERFSWIIYVFGAFLVYTGVKMAFHEEKELHPEKNPVLKLVRRFVPVTKEYEQGTFWVRRNGKLWATPLFIVALFLAITDLMFAVDSVPTIIAITRERFIVYSSNVFAVLGLRSLFFAMAGLMAIFRFLHYGLAAILVFVGLKMLLHSQIEVPVEWALGVVLGILAVSVVVSMIWPGKKEEILPNGE